MKNPKSTIAIILFLIAVLAIMYGVREIRISNIEASFNACEKENGLCTEVIEYEGESYLLPPGELYDTGLASEDFPAIDEPVFESIYAVDDILADNVYGIDVEVNGAHRFYSFQILNWHHVVNDTFGGVELAITHCPLCKSGTVYETELTFDTDGRVYNNNFLLSDRETGSTWLQLSGIAIAGEQIGNELNIYPSKTMSWEDWKNAYPNGEVLSTDTGHVRDYASHPYGEYDTAGIIYFPLTAELDTRISYKWSVYGISDSENQIAFSGTILQGFGAANETFGDQSIVGLYDYDANVIRVFNRTAGDQVLTLAYDFDAETYTDEETGSVWNANGLATSGELSGVQLDEIFGKEVFWMCWSSQYPDTFLSKIDNEGELE